MVNVVINGRTIGPGHPAYVIAEIGFNHGGDVQLGLDMIDGAAEAGVDAVKFQTFRANRLTLESWEHFQVIKHGELGLDDHVKLAERARERRLDFFSTPFCSDSFRLLEEVGVPVYKIASMDVTYIPLIREVAATGKPILLSTGMATLAEIGDAVDAALNAGGDQLVLLHCISKYPPSANEANLRTMTQISEAFGLPVGYSDHVLGNTVALASIALGACVLEKHFTIGKDLPGPDHAISADITQMRALVESIRELESAFGSRCADTSRPDRSQAAVMRRGLYAARDLKTGDVIGTDDVLCVRPENSMKPRQLDSVQGQPVAADIKAEAPLSIKSV